MTHGTFASMSGRIVAIPSVALLLTGIISARWPPYAPLSPARTQPRVKVSYASSTS
jgi:hypothetical protein